MGMSKNSRYENPYTVTGGSKHTGTKGTPTDICKDKDSGTGKGWNMERLHVMMCYQGNAQAITWFYPAESDAIVPMKSWKHDGGMGISQPK